MERKQLSSISLQVVSNILRNDMIRARAHTRMRSTERDVKPAETATAATLTYASSQFSARFVLVKCEWTDRVLFPFDFIHHRLEYQIWAVFARDDAVYLLVTSIPNCAINSARMHNEACAGNTNTTAKDSDPTEWITMNSLLYRQPDMYDVQLYIVPNDICIDKVMKQSVCYCVGIGGGDECAWASQFPETATIIMTKCAESATTVIPRTEPRPMKVVGACRERIECTGEPVNAGSESIDNKFICHRSNESCLLSFLIQPGVEI